MPFCDLRLTIDSFSQVRLCLQFHIAAIFRPGDVLIDTTSIAIWNGNKIVMTLVMMLWGTSIALHLQSKSLPSLLLQKT